MHYRPEIDGLRSVAIIPVVLYHLDLGFIAGGFTGVDVFFVISGYLITSIIFSQLSAERFSIADFYKNRAIRLLPSLVPVFIYCTIFGLLYLPPAELKILGASVASAAAFLSNVFFWSNSDYFSFDAKLNLLTHTWSLSLEEQFYIITPLLILWVSSLQKVSVKVVFITLVCLSFLCAGFLTEYYPSFSFYLLPFRFWELGAGVLIAIYGSYNGRRKWISNCFSWLGLLLIIFGFVTINSELLFPGFYAIFPVLGTSLVIIFANNTSLATLLSAGLPNWIGRISYPLYLWHWPLIVSYKILFGVQLSPLDCIILVLLSLVCADLSYRFIELPFRERRSVIPAKKALYVAALTLFSFGAVGSAVVSFPNLLKKFEPETSFYSGFNDYTESELYAEQYRPDVCFITSDTRNGFDSYDKETCLGGGEGSKNLLLLGDSHAAHLWLSLARALPDFNVMQATVSGCRVEYPPAGSERCKSLSNFVVGEFIPSADLHSIVIGGRWDATSASTLIDTIDKIEALSDAEIFILGPMVEYQISLPNLLARRSMGTLSEGDMSLFRDKSRRNLDHLMRSVLDSREEHYLSTYEAVCPRGICRLLAPNGHPVHFDYGHLTQAGADIVAEDLAQQMRAAWGQRVVE